jgi:hypothetical protein
MAKKSTDEALAALITIYTPVAPPYVNYVRTGGGLSKTKDGRICVVGRATFEGLDLIKVWAKIYRKERDIPNDRPTDAQQGNVLVDGYFDFPEVFGAKCKKNGAATNNWLAVWAEFAGNVTSRATRPFHGECNPDYCECDRPLVTFKKTAKKTAKKAAKKKVAKKAAKKKTKHG